MEHLKLTVDEAGLLSLHGENGPVQVKPVSCFPWSSPGEYVSLRDANDHEVAMIPESRSLDANSRTALETTLAQTSFVFEVSRIDSVEDELELRVWRIQTDQGARTFQTKLDEWPQPIKGGGAMIIRDLAGDLYRINDPLKLDPKSQKLFWAFRE